MDLLIDSGISFDTYRPARITFQEFHLGKFQLLPAEEEKLATSRMQSFLDTYMANSII